MTGEASGTAAGQPTGVRWSVNGITASNLPSFIYAPSSTPPDVPIILRASSQADASRFAALPVIRLLKSEKSQVNFPQAVAYHPSTGRVYVASLAARGNEVDTNIYQVLPDGTGTLVSTLTSEIIDKLVPYRTSSGTAYLLAVSVSSDSVQALNLGTRTARRVVGGLSGPVSAGIHPDSGDLYIAEQNARRVSVVTRTALETALASNSSAPFQGLPFVVPAVSGVGFLPDRDAGRVFLLVTSTEGALYQVDLQNGVFNVLTTGLRRAQELLTLQSPQLEASFAFIASPPSSNIDGQGTITAIVSGGPGQPLGGYQMATGLDVPTDLAFLPHGNTYTAAGQAAVVGVNSSPTASRGRLLLWELESASPAEFYSYVGRASPSIRLLSPADGEALQPGFPTEIRWQYSDANPLHTAYAPLSRAVQISISTDGGASFSHVETSYVPSGPRNQEYRLTWQVPADLAESQIRLRVETKDLQGRSLYATSGADVTVLPISSSIPRILSLQPNFALLGEEEATTVTISGLNFQPGAAVSIEGVSSVGAPSGVSAARIAVGVKPDSDVPEGPKSVTVCVAEDNCAVSGTPFFVLSAAGPRLSTVFPTGAAPGGVVQITGSNFSGVIENNQVFFGTRPGTVLIAEPDTLLVQVPFGLGLGRSNVRAETNGVPSNSLEFFFVSPGLGFPPAINPDGIVNGASFEPGTAPLVPGSIASVFGLGVSRGAADASSLPLERELLETTVLIGGIRAPLFVVRPNQINLQVPDELAGLTSAPAVIVSRGEAGNTVSINLTGQSPGIFSANSTGEGLGAILNQDGTLNGLDNPAAAGSFISIYATGLGKTEPPVLTGEAGPSAEPLARNVLPPEVTIDNIPAEVTYSGRAPGFVGVDQINVAVPEGISNNATVPIVLITPQGSSREISLAVPHVPEVLHAIFQTSLGTIVCELYPEDAPITVANFVGLAEGSKEWTDPATGQKTMRPLYDGTIFHRVTPEFVIQGGDPLGTGLGGPGYQFQNEITPRLRFDQPGRLGMANGGPNTNGSQFFITEVATPSLNDRYTIFGQVLEGMDVVQAIARVPRDSNDRPLEPVVLERLIIERLPGPGPTGTGEVR